MHTIFAQSSGVGKAGIAVFRISGKESLQILKKLLRSEVTSLVPKLMYHRKIYTIHTNELIDHALVVYFKAPHSFTGEDVIEIHTHGSIAIMKMLTSTLLEAENARLAEPGEFARRAFLNGKFDLTSAEGLADLIEAETIWQHRQAIRQASGELDKLYENWRTSLLRAISLLEAYIDFPDEDIPINVLNEVTEKIHELTLTVIDHLNDNRQGEILRSGIKLAITGEPNVGKSSLINFLMQREIAIVSNIPGTTRDVIEGHLDIGGYPVILQDTAGIRQHTEDEIEKEGIKRAIATAQKANIKIVMFDASNINSSVDKILENIVDENTIVVINKIDQISEAAQKDFNDPKLILISIKEHKNLKILLQEIEIRAAKLAGNLETPHITRERHRHQLKQALEHLKYFDLNDDLILATENIRMTIRALSQITGKITVDEILGEIFANFCIGK